MVASDFVRIGRLIRGAPMAATWRPLEMQLVRRDGRKRLVESDSPWFGADALIFRKRALGDLEPFLLSYGELLPLLCQEAELVMFNPTTLLPAVDVLERERSDPDGLRFSFVRKLVEGVPIFKLRGTSAVTTFLSDEAVDRFTRCGIRGLEYVKVWEG